MKTRVTILGCGPSTGVPLIGNLWGDCDPANPRNRRRRPSVAIERNNKRVLIDAGPDMRMQLLDADIRHVDAVVLTHAHADHTQGIDDLRAFYIQTRQPLPVYASEETLIQIRQRFSYMFGRTGRDGYYDQPFLAEHVLSDGMDLPVFGLQTFPQDHYVCNSVGIRAGSIGYSTDVRALDETGFAVLSGIDTWIVSVVRREPHVAHAHLEMVLEWVERLKPRRTILTHMNQSMDYEKLKAELPDYIEPGYDGMVIENED